MSAEPEAKGAFAPQASVGEEPEGARESPRSEVQATALSADPNAYDFGFEFRGSVRGHFGDVFSLVGDPRREGYARSLQPFVELHEPRPSHNLLPSQYWRARAAVAQSYGLALGPHLLTLGLVLSHESDHETAHDYARPGFLALNDLDMVVSFSLSRGPWAWRVSAMANWFFLSCTEPSRSCGNFEGDHAFGGQAALELALPGAPLWKLVPFASAFTSAIAEHGLVRGERRLSARLGFYVPFGRSVLSVFASAWSGNDVGIVRYERLHLFGAGAAFSR